MISTCIYLLSKYFSASLLAHFVTQRHLEISEDFWVLELEEYWHLSWDWGYCWTSHNTQEFTSQQKHYPVQIYLVPKLRNSVLALQLLFPCFVLILWEIHIWSSNVTACFYRVYFSISPSIEIYVVYITFFISSFLFISLMEFTVLLNLFLFYPINFDSFHIHFSLFLLNQSSHTPQMLHISPLWFHHFSP